uniref:G-protein coupled receptors family 1 profile domain-containing protein n=1 Tax=Poecilia mexicana TaxID=48701 RepID=A0A3B3YY22_9TELE
METEGYRDLLETSDGQGVGLLDGGGEVGVEEGWNTPYPVGFQVSLTTVLVLELVLGFSSNLTVLVLYCAQSNLVDSVSNLVTVNLHVLDILVCVLCLPLTVAVILVPANESGLSSLATLCCFHEACVTFTSVATAVNVLVISLDRYDISVRPASRLLTPRRAALLLTAVWAVSLSNDSELNTGTLLCVGGQGYYTGMAMYYHLLLQVPCFFIAVAVMLFTYSRILQALNIRIGSHMMRNTRSKDSTCRIRCRRQKKKELSLPTETVSSNQNQNLSHPPLIPSASVSAIIALRRAVRRHRDRRERQRRVLKMSLIIISTFMGCWAPLSAVNVLILCMGPSDSLVELRLCFLAMAYGTTIFHPLLYAFTRQKLRRALKTRVKKRVVSLLQVDPAPSGGTVIHNSWVEGGGQRKGRKSRVEASDGTDRCLTEAVRE